MRRKIVFGVVLVFFVGLQFVNSMSCYTCNSPQSCQKPWQEVCNDYTANTTSSWLSDIHSNVPQVGHSEEFKCMNLTYSINSINAATHKYLGCYHKEVDVCGLRLNITWNTFSKECHTCFWDLCNGNPAGSFSSSIFTILASVMTLLLAAKSHLII
ncbi:hypothetical protein ACLKA7_002117 [Drosophila subpalustris]